MRERSRPMLTVRGVDPEMGKVITPARAIAPAEVPAREKTREGEGTISDPSAAPDRPVMPQTTALGSPQPSQLSAAPVLGEEEVTIWLALHPLQRHAERLNALRAQGIDMVIIFRLAWQSFTDTLTLAPRYQKPAPHIWWRAHMHRKRIKLPASLLADISRNARDFGALKPTELVAAQIQNQWIAALDHTIQRVEKEG